MRDQNLCYKRCAQRKRQFVIFADPKPCYEKTHEREPTIRENHSCYAGKVRDVKQPRTLASLWHTIEEREQTHREDVREPTQPVREQTQPLEPTSVCSYAGAVPDAEPSQCGQEPTIETNPFSSAIYKPTIE